MPYTAATVPPAIQSLPAGAQAIWVAAFNAAFAEYQGDEEKSFAVAWAAVKHKFRKSGEQWVEKSAMPERAVAVNLNDLEDILVVPDYISIVGSVAHKGKGDSLDVCFRQDTPNEAIKEQVQRTLIGKDTDIIPIWNAAGPYGTYLPLFDLVLRPKRNLRRRVLDGAESPYRFEQNKAEEAVTMTALKASDELQTIWGIVMIPDVPDIQKQAFPREAIREAMHRFNARSLGKASKAIRLQHGEPIDADVVESYQAPSDLKYGENSVPEGSWVMAIKVNDLKVWKQVKAGELTGLSPRIMWRKEDAHPIKAKGEENHARRAA